MPKRILLSISLVGLLSGTLAGWCAVPVKGAGEAIDWVMPEVVIVGQPPERTKITQRMTELGVPGASVAIIQNGSILWSGGFGVEGPSGKPIKPTTAFQAGILSQLVTAAGIMRFAQKGELNIDADVNSYLKGWKLPESNWNQSDKTTIRGLLRHTAGANLDVFPGYNRGAPIPSAVQVLRGEYPSATPPIVIARKPGIYRFSSGGYLVLQKVLEDKIGQTFDTVIKKEILLPLGMTRSWMGENEVTGSIALPHDLSGVPFSSGARHYPEIAAQGLWSTPSDIARILIEIQKSASGRANGVLTTSASKQILTPDARGAGLGVRVGGGTGHRYIELSSAIGGYFGRFIAFESGGGAVIITNGGDGAQLAEEIIRSAAFTYKWPSFQPVERVVIQVDRAKTDRYIGFYQLGRYRVLQVTRDGDKVLVQLPGRNARQIYPLTEQVWVFKDNNEIVNFDIGTDGLAKSITDHFRGASSSATRIPDQQATQIRESLAEKVRAQSPEPASLVALTKLIGELRAGKPDFDSMVPGTALFVAQRLDDDRSALEAFGQTMDTSFKEVTAVGAEVYIVKFAKRTTEWTILLNRRGKIESINFKITE